jgi:flagellar biosynthesis/type III secretory pathway chaperone
MGFENVADLLEIMSKEQDALDAILELEMGKNDILVSRDLLKLAEITEKENDFSLYLSEMEDRRVSLLSSKGLGKSLSEVLERVSAEEAAKVREMQSRLAERLKKLKALNEINSRILTESIQFFRYTLELLAGEKESATLYGMNGPETGRDLKKSLVLDRKI